MTGPQSNSKNVDAFVLWFGPTGLSVARALGRAGIRVVALHHDVNEPAVDTRYAQTIILPPLERDEQVWLDCLMRCGRERSERSVLIPASDSSWLFVARHRDELDRHYRVAMPRSATPEQWIGKPFQYAAAKLAGVPHPATVHIARPEDIDTALDSMKFPCLIKPVLSHLWQMSYQYRSKLAFAPTAVEARRCANDALGRGLAVMVQEYIPARDDEIYGVFLCVDRQSRPLGWCVARKLRQHEPRFGNSCMSECVDEPRPVELAMKLMKQLGYHGIGSAEFKRDPRDGEFKLMEFNLRPTTLMGLAADSGVNLPLLLYRDLLNEHPVVCDAPQPVTPRRFGRRVGNFAQDLHVAKFYHRQEKLSYWIWIRSWIGARDIYFGWDDLRPFKGHMHSFVDHVRRGKYRGYPENFPTPEQWEAGRWIPPTRSATASATIDTTAQSACI